MGVALLCLVVATVPSRATKKDADCGWNGLLVGGKCDCDVGWTGIECSTLDLLPVPASFGLREDSVSTWGGSMVHGVDVGDSGDGTSTKVMLCTRVRECVRVR